MRGRVRAGDPDAFRALFDEHVRSVYNHAFRLTGNWSTAEDVVSVAFLEAWRLRERIDAGTEGLSLRPWLLGITTNVARNVRRSARRYDGVLARLPRAEVVPDFADEVSGRVDDGQRLTEAMAALATLPRVEREVLALCVWSGLEYTEAAQALDVPVGTVRSRLSRARRRLTALVAEGVLRPPETDRAPKREPGPGRGQVTEDRDLAVRLAQETAR